MFTAHYDMIGSFGEGNYFPGASDNGSGTAMVLDLARHFSSGRKPFYSVAFMLFSGEEAGLLGSTHYVDHPLFPLERIKLVINLDQALRPLLLPPKKVRMLRGCLLVPPPAPPDLEFLPPVPGTTANSCCRLW